MYSKYSTELNNIWACRIEILQNLYLCLIIEYVLFVQIIHLEESIVQLKEDLALEREEAVEEKERLQKAVVGFPVLGRNLI